ncbi:hypothetical protein FGL97_08995 [Pseudomonas putida]|uniref:hypothetical protein n=1 Tax=Pseudomonas putida TaxID=303 RepID=UPI00159DEE7E|nr:hypothetical protein [Pseudomonas putida]NVN63359.1 hypothetical protein [Pseudomonas putida]NVN68352.1 hypothetical protein [Pseudomonas putida]
MSKIVDFNAAALAAFKRRRAAGKLTPIKPDLSATRADIKPLDDVLLILCNGHHGIRENILDWMAYTYQNPSARDRHEVDIEWYNKALASIHPTKVMGVMGCANAMAVAFTGRSDHGALLWATYELLREADRKGYLHLFQEPTLAEVRP